MLRYLIICCLLDGGLAARKKIDISSEDGKILGGQAIDIWNAPFVAGLMNNGRYFCGGTIIDPEYVLTAAHCLREKHLRRLKVHVGSKYRNACGNYIKIRKIIIHPDYDRVTKENNIALLRLESPITPGDTAKTIKLSMAPLSNSISISTFGWSSFCQHSYRSIVLRKRKNKVINQEKCRKIYSGIHSVPDTMFCASYPMSGKDSCPVDGGGPATHGKILVGVIGLGDIRANNWKPGFYTRVSSYINWMRNETGLEL